MTHASTDDAHRLLYLDDLHVGQRFSTGAHALDESQVIAFASRFDPQPFHLDAAAARNTVFEGLAATSEARWSRSWWPGWSCRAGRPEPCSIAMT
jgi:acyl dehydratase